MDDFFFGPLEAKDTGISMSLERMNELSETVTPEFFVLQLERLLERYGRHLLLWDDTSAPRFFDFLFKLPHSSVGLLEIHPRLAGSKTDAALVTLACDLFFVQGIVSVRAHWTGGNARQARELFGTLMLPIYLKGLADKTFVRWEDGVVTKLVSGGGCVRELKTIFALARSLNSIREIENGQRLEEEFIARLNCAIEAVESNASGREIRRHHKV